MTSIKFYERDTVVKFVKNSLNQINKDCFEGSHGIITVTDDGDYLTVKGQGATLAYNPQKLWDALENYDQDDCVKFYDLWDYLQSCEQETDNGLKTDNELSFFEKRQAQLVDMLLGEVPMTESSGLDDWTISLIPQQTINTEASTLSEENKRLKESREFWTKLAFLGEDKYQECLKYITSEETRLNKHIKQLQEEYQVLEKKIKN